MIKKENVLIAAQESWTDMIIMQKAIEREMRFQGTTEFAAI